MGLLYFIVLCLRLSVDKCFVCVFVEHLLCVTGPNEHAQTF